MAELGATKNEASETSEVVSTLRASSDASTKGASADGSNKRKRVSK